MCLRKSFPFLEFCPAPPNTSSGASTAVSLWVSRIPEKSSGAGQIPRNGKLFRKHIGSSGRQHCQGTWLRGESVHRFVHRSVAAAYDGELP